MEPADGDHGFEAFVRRERSVLLGIARRLCAGGSIDPEDLVQEALERAFRQRGRLEGQPDSARRAFTRTAMTNHFLDLCRKGRTEGSAMPGVDASVAGETTAAPERPELERWALVSDPEFLDAIERLRPENLREAYRLHSRGLRYREIARRMEVPEGTVGAWLTGARSESRQLLGAAGLAPEKKRVAP